MGTEFELVDGPHGGERIIMPDPAPRYWIVEELNLPAIKKMEERSALRKEHIKRGQYVLSLFSDGKRYYLWDGWDK